MYACRHTAFVHQVSLHLSITATPLELIFSVRRADQEGRTRRRVKQMNSAVQIMSRRKTPSGESLRLSTLHTHPQVLSGSALPSSLREEGGGRPAGVR
jgi:hypothetical protein